MPHAEGRRRRVTILIAVLAVGTLSVLPAAPEDGISLTVATGPAGTGVTLSWTGGAAPYRVQRSSDVSTLSDPGGLLGITSGTAWMDDPPAAAITFYSVVMCSSGSDCASGNCADGWCCDSPCSSTCAACDLPGSQGVCAFIPQGSDPYDECSGAGVCDGAGGCALDLPNGSPCTASPDCASGFCVDGVCCPSACGGLCETCAAPGRAGFCDPVPAGQDPASECSAQAPSTCGRTGQCSGSRSCQLHPAGTVCAAAACSDTTLSQRADLCDGSGVCVDGGTQSCTPYVCNSSSGLCRTSCTGSPDCASGYTCKSGQCLVQDGGLCSAPGQCASGACCSGVCRNLLTDLSNCGSCGVVCTNPNGSTSCSAGACVPVCFGGSNCDANAANGCEVGHATSPNTCPTATHLGNFAGDMACGLTCASSTTWNLVSSQTGRSSRWFRARALENAGCTAPIQQRVRLGVPAGVDYDLYVYTPCGTLAGSSNSPAGTSESITLCVADTFSDNSFDYWIEVRWFSGGSCSNWTLEIDAH